MADKRFSLVDFIWAKAALILFLLILGLTPVQAWAQDDGNAQQPKQPPKKFVDQEYSPEELEALKKTCKGLKPFNDLPDLIHQFYLNLDSECLFKLPVSELEKFWEINIFVADKEAYGCNDPH